MALTDEGNGGIPATMLVAPTGAGAGMPYPVYMGGQQSGGNSGGWDQGNGWWIILLFILLASGNCGGNNGNGGGQMSGFSGGSVGGLYPWLNQSEQINDGFRDQMLNDSIMSIRDGVQGLSTQLCNCCSDIQMSNMQTAFTGQTAMAQGFNGLQAQLAQCCCDNRAGLADLKYTVATENCADRQTINEGVRDIIASQTAGTQRILDQLCADKIDAKNDIISQLRQELIYARGQASQDVQTARILAGQTSEVDALYNRLNNCPVGTVPVYGRQPIFTCQNNGCGCGCGCGA